MRLTPNKKVVFDDFTHTYLCGEKVLMGVTTLMKKHNLSPDYGGIDENVLAAAATRGSAVHKLLENYDNGEQIILRDVYHEWIDENGEKQSKCVITAADLEANFKAYQALNLKALASEFLISDNKIVASSIDKVLASDKPGFVDIGDIKTTSTLHIKALEWQLGIYKYLLEKQCKTVKVDKCYGIHIRNGVAKKTQINPVSSEKVAALLAAEAKGVLYVDDSEAPTTALVLNEEELNALVSAEKSIAQYDVIIEELKSRSKDLKERIYQYMIDNNLDTLTCKDGTFTLKRPYTTYRVDSKKLKSKYPDVANECTIQGETKGSVSFKPVTTDEQEDSGI